MNARDPSTETATRVLRSHLRRSRARWRMRRTLEGVAVALFVLCLATLLAIGFMDFSRFDEQIVRAVRQGLYVVIAGCGALFVLLPLFTRMNDRRLAYYIEKQHPELDALLFTAVDQAALRTAGESDSNTSPALSDALMRQAAQVLASSPVAGVERPKTLRALLAVACGLGLAVTLFHYGPATVRHGFAVLFAPNSGEAARNPYSIEVKPGDTTLLAGTDLRIQAVVKGFQPEAMDLYTMADGQSRWQRVSLEPGSSTDHFEVFLFDVDAAFRYQVRDGELASATHTVKVIPRPVAKRIDLVYRYPERTGRAPREVQDGGDIDAIRGTQVEIRITPSHATDAGQLVIDGERTIALRLEQGMLRAEVEVERDARYRVELEATGHGMVQASPEHAITARSDTLPSLALLSPGRDVRVTSIEEIVVSARAEDDVAVRELELVMSVNGGIEEVLPLSSALAPSPSVEGQLELLLEQRELSPGDLIAYYLQARDAPDDETRLVKSDIFFMDVRPFEMNYRRGRGGGGGGGGQNGGGDQNLSAQQRALVVALFKLDRDRAILNDDVMAERVALLADAQSRIRTRTDAIVRRLGARSIVNLNPGYRRMATELPQAAKAMEQVESMLRAADLRKALPAARMALLHLQRADAAMRDVQVAQSQRGGGGGGDAANDLSSLFRLEMDRFRNQYEDLQRGNSGSERRELDDTLRKLKALAERQQRELERARADANAGSSDAQRALAEEVEKLVRELARLTRKRQDDEALRQSMQELENAARAMRRSGQAGDVRAGAEALDRLRAARERLDRGSAGRLKRRVSEAQQRAEDMAQSQREIARAVQRAQGGASQSGQQRSSQGAQQGDQVQRGGQDGGRASGPSSQSDEASGADQSRRQSAQGGQGGVADPSRDGGGGSAGDASGSRIAAGSEELQRSQGESPEAIVTRKESLADQVRDMESLLDRLSVQARQEQQSEAAQALKDTAQNLRGAQTADRIRQSAERLARDAGGADPKEEGEIEQALNRLQQRLAGASQLVGESDSTRASRLLDRLRGSMQGVDRARSRLADAARGGSTAPRRSGDGLGRGSRSGFGGGVTAQDIDAMREAFAARDGELLSLAEALQGEQDFRGELGGLMDALKGIRADEAADAEILALRHGTLLSALQALERRLREKVESEHEVATASLPRAEALPPQRDQAERYYRSLSERVTHP